MCYTSTSLEELRDEKQKEGDRKVKTARSRLPSGKVVAAIAEDEPPQQPTMLEIRLEERAQQTERLIEWALGKGYLTKEQVPKFRRASNKELMAPGLNPEQLDEATEAGVFPREPGGLAH